MKIGYVYIMSNKRRTTLYIGVTNDLERRVLEHKAGVGSQFTSKYLLNDLLYFEEFQNIRDAIVREKQLKNWHRKWKIDLIIELNPELKNLAADWFTVEEILGFREAFLEEKKDIIEDPEEE